VKVFISYRREDSAGHSGRLYDSLQAHLGADGVFMDLRGIDSGQNFADVIHTAIRSSDVLLAVIGREWLSCTGTNGRRLDDPHDFVRTEIATALALGTPIIPVLVDGTSMPRAASLPDLLKPLSKRDAHELSDERWSYDVGRLIVATEKLTGKTSWWERRPWRSLAAAVAILAILGGAYFFLGRRAPAPGPQDADSYAVRGAQLLTNGDYDGAITAFDRALAIDPRPESYYNRGLAYHSKKNIDKAIADWNTVINLDARDVRAYRQRGNGYFTKGDFSLAIADYSRAIELDPKDPKAYYNRGVVFQTRGELARAAADFNTVITLGGDADAERDARARLSQLESSPRVTPAAGASLAGDWIAEVTYDWGAKHRERFRFKVDGNDVLGTASFLEVRRGIVNGSLNGDRVLFQTQTQEIAGDKTSDVVHSYRGTLAGDVITFYMQSEGGSSTVPVEFTAERVRP
jgi:tetratricopeptide (TPR) repeat protein